MKSSLPRHLNVIFAMMTLTVLASSIGLGQAVEGGHGEVEVRGNKLLRDGRPWIPHGYYQIAFEVAPKNLGRADHPFWRTAYDNYSPQEYADMRDAGADSVRLQISQLAADPASPLFDKQFLQKALDAVRAARAVGLTVIVSVQDESHVPGETPIDFPDDGTLRVWRIIAPFFAYDRGVMYELLNEPRPEPNAENWAMWARTMTAAINIVRTSGAKNVLIADGLGVGQSLDGAPLLRDQQVVYASHPYALQQYGQTKKAWDGKFGDFSRRAPVIISEWLFGGYFCNADTPDATVKFVQYLQDHGIGLEAGIWDWAPGGFGSARWGFPNGKVSTFNGLSCHKPGYGIGQVVESWFKTGAPPKTPQ
jgi:endoglucanase